MSDSDKSKKTDDSNDDEQQVSQYPPGFDPSMFERVPLDQIPPEMLEQLMMGMAPPYEGPLLDKDVTLKAFQEVTALSMTAFRESMGTSEIGSKPVEEFQGQMMAHMEPRVQEVFQKYGIESEAQFQASLNAHASEDPEFLRQMQEEDQKAMLAMNELTGGMVDQFVAAQQQAQMMFSPEMLANGGLPPNFDMNNLAAMFGLMPENAVIEEETEESQAQSQSASTDSSASAAAGLGGFPGLGLGMGGMGGLSMAPPSGGMGGGAAALRFGGVGSSPLVFGARDETRVDPLAAITSLGLSATPAASSSSSSSSSSDADTLSKDMSNLKVADKK